jgi:aminoglycoside 6'-N-acetyltransferase I
MTIEIKMLGPADAGALAALAPGVFDDPLDLAATGEFLNDRRHHLAVALEQGVVVGFVSAVHYVHPDKRRPELWINEVGVAPSHQGRGLGKLLLQATLDRGRQLGCSEAWVLADSDNEPAIRLYSSAGGHAAPKAAVTFTFRLGPTGSIIVVDRKQ